jgi:hypothetical protein
MSSVGDTRRIHLPSQAIADGANGIDHSWRAEAGGSSASDLTKAMIPTNPFLLLYEGK